MHARITARLSAHADAVRPLVMDNDGRIRVPDAGPPAEPAAPTIVFASADAFFSPAAGPFLKTALASPRLQWFQSGAAGIEHPALAAFGRKAPLYTACHAQAAAIAEWVLWQSFDFLRRGPQRRVNQAAREWTRLASREIAGTRFLILGFGEIGRETARRLRALGGHVTGLRRSPGPDPDADAMVPPAALLPELTQAEIVLSCLPHAPETEGLLGAAAFAAMRPEALFLNVGRGAVLDEAALLAGLDAGRPAFAALDVFVTEPLPQTSPFWHHPRVFVSPHNSTETPGTEARVDAFMLDNLGRFLANQPLRHLVPKSAFGEG